MMAQAAAQQAVRIHRYAAFDPRTVDNKRISTLSAHATGQRTQLSVYGSQLTLRLEHNKPLTESLPAQASGPTLLRGSLEGKPQSWARLTKTNAGTYGLIWDGAELYVIEPSADIRSALAVSLPVPNSETVIFKLSDTTIDLGAEYCGSHQAATANVDTGLATYQAIAGELSDQTASATGGPTLILELQALADAAVRARYSSDQAARDAIMVRLNNIDGIFSAQMGLQIHAANVTVYDQDSTALSASSSADTLLNSLGQLRSSDPVMRTYAATHLFTGRDLDGDTLGIAYMSSICGARYGSSLSELRNRGAWIDSLVAAHELGHQLGAVHDGEGVCGGTAAQSYLMGSQINGSSELSQCSRDSIFATLQYAACLIPVTEPDVTIASANSQLQFAPGTSFTWSLPVQNIGTATANALSVQVTVPVGVMVAAATVAGGSCVANPNNVDTQVNCQFDSLAAFATRSLALTLHSTQLGSYIVGATVSAAADSNLNNNSATFTLEVSTNATTPTSPTSTVTAATEPTGSGGGGGAMNPAWLWMLVGLAGLRYAGVRQHRAQPLHHRFSG